MLLEGKMQRSGGGRPLPVSTHASRSLSLTSMSASTARATSHLQQQVPVDVGVRACFPGKRQSAGLLLACRRATEYTRNRWREKRRKRGTRSQIARQRDPLLQASREGRRQPLLLQSSSCCRCCVKQTDASVLTIDARNRARLAEMKKLFEESRRKRTLTEKLIDSSTLSSD